MWPQPKAMWWSWAGHRPEMHGQWCMEWSGRWDDNRQYGNAYRLEHILIELNTNALCITRFYPSSCSSTMIFKAVWVGMDTTNLRMVYRDSLFLKRLAEFVEVCNTGAHPCKSDNSVLRSIDDDCSWWCRCGRTIFSDSRVHHLHKKNVSNQLWWNM